jgi:hypothetical protein
VLGIQETSCILIAGLLERNTFDLFLPEFDKPCVIHLRETCCCSINLCTWRPNTVYKNRSVHKHHPSIPFAAGPRGKLLVIKELLLIEYRSKALTLREHMFLTSQPSPPIIPIIVTLGPWVPDNDMCIQLAGKITNNNYLHETITCSDLRSWHSGPK